MIYIVCIVILPVYFDNNKVVVSCKHHRELKKKTIHYRQSSSTFNLLKQKFNLHSNWTICSKIAAIIYKKPVPLQLLTLWTCKQLAEKNGENKRRQHLGRWWRELSQTKAEDKSAVIRELIEYARG